MIVPPAQIKNPLDGNQKILSNPSYSRIPAKSVKTDFFIMEAPTDPFKKLWNKNSKTFPKNLLEMEVILRMQLVKVGKKMHLVNTRNYYFTDEYIYYKKVLFFIIIKKNIILNNFLRTKTPKSKE